MASNDGDRRKLLDQINKLKSSEMRLDNDMKRLKESNELGEMKQTETEVKRRKLEGELQRLKLQLHDKETEVQVLHERSDSLTKQLSSTETKCQNLQVKYLTGIHEPVNALTVVISDCYVEK